MLYCVRGHHSKFMEIQLKAYNCPHPTPAHTVAFQGWSYLQKEFITIYHGCLLLLSRVTASILFITFSAVLNDKFYYLNYMIQARKQLQAMQGMCLKFEDYIMFFCIFKFLASVLSNMSF